MENLESYRKELAGKNPEEALKWCQKEFGPERIILASSFSAEDQVLTDMLAGIGGSLRIFTLDTGRLFQETYDVMQKSMERYGIRYEICLPRESGLASLLSEAGPNSMYRSREEREECCRIRKVEPLKKILSTADAWICGLRRDQAFTRKELEILEWDAAFGVYKISPLFDWTEEQVWQYIRRHDVPYNALYDRGFRSIGCSPCTRSVGPDEDVRAGRWWWEEPERKECGLHVITKNE